MLSISSWGWRRSAAFLVIGYVIAWGSEASSIRNGFPYGRYSYLYENLRGEWLMAGVPVWDSLSYVFLCYAGLSLASVTLSLPKEGEGSVGTRSFASLKMTTLAALFVTILDIVIDPVANMGERWFLGKIYFYPHPGFYFGVPVANFAGWFLVSFTIVGVNLVIPPLCKGRSGGVDRGQRRRLPPSLFYFSIFLFNWIITLSLREWLLALLDLVWISIPAILLATHWRGSNRKERHRST